MNCTTAMDESPENRNESLPGEHVLNRIAWLTLGFGFASAVVAALLHRIDWAEGLASGAVLGWLNFRWLRRGVLAIVKSASTTAMLAVAENRPEITENKSDTRGLDLLGVLLMLFRYALLGLSVYVIFSYLHVPLVSIALGLCALGAAIMAASVWEVLKPAA
jgi:uncharacterized membrane protein YqjE